MSDLMDIGEYDFLDEEIVVDEDDKFDSTDLTLPSTADLVSIKDIFGEDLSSPEQIRAKVREMYLPQAILTYTHLMERGEDKIKKAAADEIVKISGVLEEKKIGKPGEGGTQINILQMLKDGENPLGKALDVLSSRGEEDA